MEYDTRSHSAFERRVALWALLALGASGAPQKARADDKKECVSGYEQTQTLMQGGKLVEAEAAAHQCTADTCKAFMRDDCNRWLADIKKKEPTVIIAIKNAKGEPISDAKVTIDGQPFLDHVDGQEHAVDAGKHTIRIQAGATVVLDDSFTIAEGEKGKTINAVTQAPGTSGGGEPVESSGHPMPVGPFIVGGIGIASLVVSAVTGGLLLHDNSVYKSECDPTTKVCNSDKGVSAANQGRVIGPVTTATLVVGGAALAGGVIWLVVDRTSAHSSAKAARVVPIAGPGVGGVVVEGAF